MRGVGHLRVETGRGRPKALIGRVGNAVPFVEPVVGRNLLFGARVLLYAALVNGDRMNRRDFTVALLAVGAAAALPRSARGYAAAAVPLSVNGERLNAHLAALAEFGKNPQGGVSRVAYTDADLASRPFLMKLMRDAKLDVFVDTAGNIHGHRSEGRR